MNIALEETSEWVEGRERNRYGDAFVRGNNGEYWPLREQDVVCDQGERGSAAQLYGGKLSPGVRNSKSTLAAHSMIAPCLAFEAVCMTSTFRTASTRLRCESNRSGNARLVRLAKVEVMKTVSSFTTASVFDCCLGCSSWTIVWAAAHQAWSGAEQSGSSRRAALRLVPTLTSEDDRLWKRYLNLYCLPFASYKRSRVVSRTLRQQPCSPSRPSQAQHGQLPS